MFFVHPSATNDKTVVRFSSTVKRPAQDVILFHDMDVFSGYSGILDEGRWRLPVRQYHPLRDSKLPQTLRRWMLDGSRSCRILRGALRRIVIVCLVLVVLGFLALALKVRRMPDLSPWHTVTLESRFRASDAGGDFDFSDYLVNEEKLFRELEDRLVSIIPTTPDNAWCRYAAGGVTNPSHFPVNWNRTTELRPAEPIGRALLLHGLTDSPYSLRAVAEMLYDAGYHVIALRLPGHGINSGALATARLRDWRAAVDLGARQLETGDPGHCPVEAGQRSERADRDLGRKKDEPMRPGKILVKRPKRIVESQRSAVGVADEKEGTPQTTFGLQVAGAEVDCRPPVPQLD